MKKVASRRVGMGKETDGPPVPGGGVFCRSRFRPEGFTQIRLARESGVSLFRLCTAETEQGDLRRDELEALRKVLRPALVKVARMALEVQE